MNYNAEKKSSWIKKEVKLMKLFSNYVIVQMKSEIHLQVGKQEMKQLIHLG